MVLIVVVTFGILVPWYKGFTLSRPENAERLCLSGAAVRGACCRRSFRAQQSKMSRSALLGKIGLIVVYGWAVTVLILTTAFITLNLTNRRGVLIPPPWALCRAAGLQFRRVNRGGDRKRCSLAT